MVMAKLQAAFPDISPPVPGMPWPAMTMNLGPQTNVDPHRDFRNLGSSVCLDYTDGDFDSCRVGHLIMHEAKRIIEFPPGNGALFPSALTTHETIPVGPLETRNSMTAYMAGGLVQFADQQNQTQRQWELSDLDAFMEYKAGDEQRWERAVSQFKTIPELQQYWKASESSK